MTKFAKTILALILLVILIIGVLIYSKKDETLNTNINEPTQVVSSSVKGCYMAKLGKDVYVLNINNQEGDNVSGMLAYNNFQKDSSSGSISGTFRDDILLINYSFDSEGMRSNRQIIFNRVGDNFIQGFGPVKVVGDKEMLEDPSTVTYDPKSTFVKLESCIETFTDSNNTFTFNYNPFWKSIPGDKIPTLDWRSNAKQKGILLARVIVPKAYMEGTNFSSAKLTVGVSTDANEIKSCLTPVVANEVLKQETDTTISGYSFKKSTSREGAAGSFYEATNYRGIIDGDCYAIEYMIHSTNIGNYSPDQGIKEFDKSSIQNELEMVVKSFKSLINSD